MEWKELEDNVREIASYRWNCNAVSETISGIRCDCVLKLNLDNWVVIEITEENDLAKVRTDIAKLRTIKNALMVDDVYCKCYMVMKDKPTDSMRQSGDAQKITVMSIDEFKCEYFDYKSYIHIRSKKQFGSLINAETGEPEQNTYINVSYSNKKKNDITINDIINMLKKGKKIVLKGDFGLGKSRCVKQIFDILNSEMNTNNYTIAINLRDHWGARRGIEILTRHFEDLGLDAKNFIKTYDQTNAVYLLDGFDEIGTQSWSSDIRKMQHMREMSVCALKDFIMHVRGGVLIVGREYYFNSDQELLNCLGLKENQTTILECPNEFTDSELLDFITNNVPDSIDKRKMEELPQWLPKRPYVIQMLLKYASEVFSVDYALDDICGFWYAFLSKMCEREAKIYPALNPDIIKQVLIILANKTRTEGTNTGPITQSDLSAAFELAAGFQPNDESSVMLQRLPSLGRIGADSPDRQFLDTFILNGLRAEGIIQAVKSWDKSILTSPWKYPLDTIGYSILAEYISKDKNRDDIFLSMAREASNSSNKIFAADVVAAISYLDVNNQDYKNLYISDSHFSHLSFEEKIIQGLEIYNSIIDKLDLTNAKFDNSITIKDCFIGTIYGIASHKSVPTQIVKCDVDCFETLATTTLIKRAKLSEIQKIFVTIIKRIFFQPGAGRKEEALLRGMGRVANKHSGEKILNILLNEKIITRHKGDEGYVYKPVRSLTNRMDKILTDLTLSTDPLWCKISQIS
jgi:energy-coupling factor transporter ATP-binding protein EcfA2